jgi:cytochrome c oxidase subunit 4
MTAAHSTGRYLLVFAALAVLTLVTVGAAQVDLGGANVGVALAIAGFKASLVLLFFMHASTSSRLIWGTIGAACLWLVLLIGLTMVEVATRSELRAAANRSSTHSPGEVPRPASPAGGFASGR